MANVKFLRGNQSTLPSGNSIVDGALYVTLDTKRLFMGYESSGAKELIPIAEGITTVTSVSSLPAAADHEGEFYYVTSGNILAWSNGTSWLQTNKDTQLVGQTDTALSVASGSTTDTAEVSLSLADTDGTAVTGSFIVAPGSTNVHIGAGANGELEISVDAPTTYELKSEGGANNNSANDIALVLDPSSGNDQKVLIKNSTTVGVRRTAGASGAPDEISFVVNEGEISGIQSATLNPLSGSAQGVGGESSGYELDVVTTSGTHNRDYIDPEIRYGASYNAASGYQSANFVDDVLLLNVPTNAELTSAIQNLEKTINALRYMGVAASAAQIPNANAGNALHNGDVYLANDNFTIGGKTVKPGYLIIVQGQEGTDGTIPSADVTYDVVAGNDTDTTYTLEPISHGVELQDGDSNPFGSLTLAEGTSISLVDSGTTDKTITIGHSSVTRSDPALDTSDTNYTQTSGMQKQFTVVSGVTTNAQGHVTAVTTKQVTVVDTQLNPGTWGVVATAANNVATITATNTGDLGSLDFDIASTGSLSITASGDTVTIDLVWGTF